LERKSYRELIKVLGRHGIHVLNFEHGKKHGKMKITDGQATAIIITAKSPSDFRTLKNMVSDAKKTLMAHRPR
jgi:hypothetical protein